MTTTKKRSAPEGVVKRHARACASRGEGACDCVPTWQAHAWDPKEAKKIRKTFPTAAAAKSWRAGASVAIADKKLRAVKSPTLAVAAADMLAGMRSGAIRARRGVTYKPSTVASHESSLREHVLPTLGRTRLSDVSRGNLTKMIERMLGAGLSGSTVRNAVNPLHLVFRHALDAGTIAVSPTAALRLSPPSNGRDRIATPVEQAALLAALAPADRALWTVALGAGLRAGELQALRWEDVDLAEGVIRVRRSWDPKSGGFVAPKSAAGRRSVPLLAGVRSALLAHRLASGRREGLVFGRNGERPFSHSSCLARAYTAWQAAAIPPLVCDVKAAQEDGAPLPEYGRVGLHEARHTYCSTMIAAGVPVANVSLYAGHANPAFTMARYVHGRKDGTTGDAGTVDAFLAAVGAQVRATVRATRASSRRFSAGLGGVGVFVPNPPREPASQAGIPLVMGEATTGVEPVHGGFADRCVPISPGRRDCGG